MSWTHLLKHLSGLIGIIAGAIWGNMDSLFLALIIFVCIDYLTGILDAIYTKTLSSEIGFRGIVKKVIIFILVAVGNVIDVYIIRQGASVRTMVIFFYLANEGISILENVVKLDIPVPDKLYDILKKLDENS